MCFAVARCCRVADSHLEAAPPLSLALLGGDDDDEAALAVVAAYEAELAAETNDAVTAWLASVEAATSAQAQAISLERLQALVDAGASAYRVNVKYLPGGGATARLASLCDALRSASAWHVKCTEQLAKPQSPEAVAALLAEAEAIPVRLIAVEEVRGRLERTHVWLEGVRKVLGGVCELRELQELQREAEALRVKLPEAEALATRTAACKKWVSRVNNELLRRTSSRKAYAAAAAVAPLPHLARAARARAPSAPLPPPPHPRAPERCPVGAARLVPPGWCRPVGAARSVPPGWCRPVGAARLVPPGRCRPAGAARLVPPGWCRPAGAAPRVGGVAPAS